MDYVFFAFNSLCVSFSFLLAFQLADRRNRQLHVFFFFLAAATPFGYYYLEKTFFAKKFFFTTWVTVCLEIILLVLLGLSFGKARQHDRYESSAGPSHPLDFRSRRRACSA